ncbi:MAG: 50S ribosomal protein L3 N(5)-glutamine methyltransferase [Proteobacteria bacterium]|nr:50S ribosomal protein L3 N(5)-glutamine methyltransferase [Pseudomonadota bacterium]
MTDKTSTAGLPNTVGEALQYCAERLQASDAFFGHGTDNPWDEAVALVLSIADLPLDADDGVLPHKFSSEDAVRMHSLLSRRIDDHVPLPYLLGRAWFAGLEFVSDRRAIIPRSPLAELILHEFKPWYQGPEPRRVLDLCCGGGCIGLAVAYYYPAVTVDLTDLDKDALDLAAENVALLQLSGRASVLYSDLFSSLPSQKYDIILSNPPYVNREDLSSMPAEFHHEPPLALGSGPDGLALTRKILQQGAQYLTEQGLLIVEVGNSWPQLEALYPDVAFTWLEFEHGGQGVFAITAKELQQYSASFT